MNRKDVNGSVANRVRLLVPSLPVSEASLEQLRKRLKSTVRVQNQAAAIRAEIVSELRRRKGTEMVETVLQTDGLLGRRRARSEVETAKALEEMPKTREGLRAGEISHDNARILAGANQRGTIAEDELLDDARSQSPDKFAATVRKHEQQRARDDGVSRLEHQRSRRFARITTDQHDGMTVLYGRFDPVTGARVETAVSHMMKQLWHKEDPQDRATSGQRMADALSKLLTRQGKDGRSQDVRLLLIADYDTINQQLKDARLSDGTPIPARALRQLACDAQVLPAIFSGSSIPLDLGRARRKASPAQRSALIARDKHCVGCGAKAAWCQAHHIIHWADGGPTDLNNMCLLCSRCHHKVHDNHWQVERTTNSTYRLRPPPTQRGRPPHQNTSYRRGRTRRPNSRYSRKRRPTIKQRK